REGAKSPAPAPGTRRYGSFDNVTLSDRELETLQTKCPDDWEERIERLSSYMASSGKTYKNHLATIQRWAARDRQEAREKAPEKVTEKAPSKPSRRRRWSELAAEMEAEIGGNS
ncbi:MAG: hypothetical protein LIO51_05655, partial [Clostridiales bacterium]|nr:hypothetical protein [Clostridiales bacterium]